MARYSAAMEGTILGVPSVAVSQEGRETFRFPVAADYAARIVRLRFAEHLRAIGLPTGQRAAIAHFVAANDEDMRVGPTLLDLRDRAHEDVEAAIGFEVARDIGDDLILCGEAEVAPVDLKPGIGVGTNSVRVDPLMQHGYARAHFRRIEIALPFGWRIAPVSRFEAQQIDRVAHPQAAAVIRRAGKFGVEIGVDTGMMIEEFEIAQQRGVGIDVLDEQRLAPAAVADDDVRRHALRLQHAERFRDRLAMPHRDFEIDGVPVALDRRGEIGIIDELDDALHPVGVGLRDEIDCVVRVVRQMPERESAETVPAVPGMEPRTYIRRVFERVANPAIRHTNHQVATDGSQKIVQRLLNPIRDRIRQGRDVNGLTTAVAGWIAYLMASSARFGQRWRATDPWAAEISSMADRGLPEIEIVREEHFLPLLHDEDIETQYLCEMALRRRNLTDDDIKLARMVSHKDPAVRMGILHHLPHICGGSYS